MYIGSVVLFLVKMICFCSAATILMQLGLCEYSTRVRLNHFCLLQLPFFICSIKLGSSHHPSQQYQCHLSFLSMLHISVLPKLTYRTFFPPFQVAIKSWQMNTYCSFKLCPFFLITDISEVMWKQAYLSSFLPDFYS